MTPHEKTTPLQNKKTLILDLDETLIHADFDVNWSEHDHTVYFHYEGHQVSVPIIIRPGVFQFLEKIAEIFEIYIFTASKKEYADAILNFLDPENKIFAKRFYREHCINFKNRIFIKDMRIFADRKPENLIILDNSLYSFSNQLSNGILINSFYSDKDDRELFNVFNYLEQYLQNADDVRVINEQIFNFNLILKEYSRQLSEISENQV
jgi:CTD small phosphatase-like protein 2